MVDDSNATRRSFLKGGAMLAAPLAMTIPAAAFAADDRAARLKRLEDEAAVRALHQDWLRRINGRNADMTGLFVSAQAAQCLDEATCSITPDHSQAEQIWVDVDGKRATGQFVCMVESESRIVADTTLAQMALAQGGGLVRLSERKLVSANYVKAGERWMIALITLAEV